MKQEITKAIEEAEKELREKQIEEFANDIHEATRRASKILIDETRAFVKEHHRYHSKNDFDKAHPKTLAELEAEYLTEQGYQKQEWISVEDRLPDENTDVLICQGNCFGQLMNVYTYLGDNKWEDEYGYWHITEDTLMTHWQPLPKPPKMKGAE